jgi:Glycosyl hydrolase family 9
MMGTNGEKITRVLYTLLCFLVLQPMVARGGLDYRDALTKSFLYFEAQRSGHLPYNQRVTWRGHSGLTDGLEQGVSL